MGSYWLLCSSHCDTHQPGRTLQAPFSVCCCDLFIFYQVTQQWPLIIYSSSLVIVLPISGFSQSVDAETSVWRAALKWMLFVLFIHLIHDISCIRTYTSSFNFPLFIYYMFLVVGFCQWKFWCIDRLECKEFSHNIPTLTFIYMHVSIVSFCRWSFNVLTDYNVRNLVTTSPHLPLIIYVFPL